MDYDPTKNSEDYVPQTALHSTKHDMSEADFRTFVVLWNQRQSMTTPHLHMRMIEWLELKWKFKKPENQAHLLLMAFRSAGKSTLVGLYAAWLLYRNPDLRILVLAADQSLAGKMVRNVKRILERHPMTADTLKPDAPDQWASSRFTVKRMIELRDPSMVAYGISSNITGARADIIICDDVEVPKTSDTAGKRAGLREKLLELDYILVPGGMMLYVGTPHHYYSIYAQNPRTDIGEEQIFLHGYDREVIPVMDEQGCSVWPERFSQADITRIRNHTGVNKFTSQMMLKPVNIAEGRLNASRLKRYDGEVALVKELNRLEINNIPMVAACAYWDPSFGSERGDGSVLAIAYIDEKNNFYLHDMMYLKTDPRSNVNEAQQQCENVARAVKNYHIPRLVLESNGIGKFLPSILKQEIAKARAACSVGELHTSRAKDTRILEAFDIALETRRLHVHDRVYATPFMAEIQDWKPSKTGAKDDGLDAAAGAISNLHESLGAARIPGRHSWMRGGQITKANTDFKV
jgi:hypothetical protein